MGFFFENVKREQAKRPKPTTRHRDIPIQSLNKLGCSVCPRDKDTSLHTPKMPPEGDEQAPIYILMPAPSRTDDDRGQWLQDKVGRIISRAVPGDIRVGAVIQCATDTVAIGQHETECCRGRVVSDIERVRPKVILGVGDAPLAWVTGLDAYAPRFRGRFLAAKVGDHRCWYYGINYPNWVFKESKYGPSDHEVVFHHDIDKLMEEINDLPEFPDFKDGPYDKGITLITGEHGADDFRRLETHLSELTNASRTALDLETTGLRPWKLKDPMILMAAVGTYEDTVAFALDDPDGWDPHYRRKAWSLFVEYLLESRIKECHNLAFELEWLAYFIDPRITRLTEWDDTMSMAHTIDKRPGTKGLDVQTLMYYGFDLKAQSRVDVSRPQWWTQYPMEEKLRYNGMDTKWTNYHSRTLRREIARDAKLQWSHDRKVRLASTLVLTEYRGLPVDMQYAKDLEARFQAQAEQVEERIARCPEVVNYRREHGQFSPTNSDQVLALMKALGRDEIQRTTKEGTKWTTDEEALSAIPAREVPSAPLILEHRGVEKLLSTYIRPLTSGKLLGTDGMIHAKYSSMTAVTDRLAAEDPNSQNWPKRKHKEVRGVARARSHRWIMACDYGQIEFRVAGMASEDDNLVKYCWTGYDVHKYWAERMVQEYGPIKDHIVSTFSVDWDEKGLKTLRQEAKNGWVFPSIFGAAVQSRAGNMNLPLDVAQRLDDEFWDEFPGVKRWQKKLVKSYEKRLYVETLGGNRRYGPMSLNEIINMPIQGTAAEIVTEAMVAISEKALIEDRLDDRHPIINVHDDLTYEPYDEDLEAAIDFIVPEMCRHRFPFINVPLVVEVSIGERWSDLKEIGVYRSDALFNLPNPYKD